LLIQKIKQKEALINLIKQLVLFYFLFLHVCLLSQTRDSIIDIRDGKVYHTAKIGNQIWLSQNLNYKVATGSWCYLDIEDNCGSNGRLYTVYTAQNACPEGWHLPSDEEW